MILDAQLSSEQVERGSVEADFWHGECMDDAKKNAQKSEFYQGHLHVEFGPMKKTIIVLQLSLRQIIVSFREFDTSLYPS